MKVLALFGTCTLLLTACGGDESVDSQAMLHDASVAACAGSVNSSELGSCHYDVSLSLAGECGSGQLAYQEDGFCHGSTASKATAVRVR